MKIARPLLLSLSVLLVSCSNLEGRIVSGLLSETPDELLRSGHRNEEQCLTQSLAQVQEKVRGYVERCHRSYTTTVAYPTVYGGRVQYDHRVNWRVEERNSASGGKQFFVRHEHGYTLGVTVQAAAECKVAVQVFAANFGWKNRFERVLAAAKGESPECLGQ